MKQHQIGRPYPILRRGLYSRSPRLSLRRPVEGVKFDNTVEEISMSKDLGLAEVNKKFNGLQRVPPSSVFMGWKCRDPGSLRVHIESPGDVDWPCAVFRSSAPIAKVLRSPVAWYGSDV